MSRRTHEVNATGRRKSSTARVYLSLAENDEGTITVNKKNFTDYFSRETIRQVVMQPLELVERVGKYDFTATVRGGGKSGQAGALLHGISRALETHEPELRPILKQAGFLTRDPRVVERKKPGRHKARKKPQFSKR